MNIEWFGTERSKPDPWVIENPEGKLDTYSDGTPKMYETRKHAMFEIFNNAMDKILYMDGDSLSENGITPVMMDVFIMLLHTEDLDSIEDVVMQHRVLNPEYKEARTLKSYTNK